MSAHFARGHLASSACGRATRPVCPGSPAETRSAGTWSAGQARPARIPPTTGHRSCGNRPGRQVSPRPVRNPVPLSCGQLPSLAIPPRPARMLVDNARLILTETTKTKLTSFSPLLRYQLRLFQERSEKVAAVLSSGAGNPLLCAPRRDARRNCVGEGCAARRGLGGGWSGRQRTLDRTSHVSQLSFARDWAVANDHPRSRKTIQQPQSVHPGSTIGSTWLALRLPAEHS